MADPDWTFDVVSTGDQVVQVLRAKDPNAPARSPIEISFTAELRADSDEARGLETGDAFGYAKPLILPGETIKDFKITGPRLVARDDRPDQLEFHPLVDQPDWKPSELVLRNKAGDQLGIYLADSRILTSGSKGFTLQARLGRLLDLNFPMPIRGTTRRGGLRQSQLRRLLGTGGICGRRLHRAVRRSRQRSNYAP